MSYRIVPTPKLKRDYYGKTVRTLRPMNNGYTCTPAGSIALVVGTANSIGLIFSKCPHCGVQTKISKVNSRDLEFIELEAKDFYDRFER